MQDHERYNDRLFSRWAPVYDAFEIVLGNIRKQVAHEINPTRATILDVATGTGSMAMALSATATEVVGIDLSTAMLHKARSKRGKRKLTFLQMDASSMTFADETFDIVTISLGLHDMPQAIRSRVVGEVRRVLKKDGRLFILEHDLPAHPLLSYISSRLMNLFESKYYLDFMQTDLDDYLQTLGFRVEANTRYLGHHLRLITLSKQ